MHVLIIGMAGHLAKLVAKQLLKSDSSLEIIGIDSRPIPESPNLKVTNIQMNYNRGNFEKLFRKYSIASIIFLGRLVYPRHVRTKKWEKQLSVSSVETNRICELAIKYNVKRMVVLSSFHVYGAYVDNPLFINESMPLRASHRFEELREFVERDEICLRYLWRYQNKLSIVLLRPCHILGDGINNVFSKYLRSSMIFYPMDYNPSFQFIHVFDLVRVIELALNKLAPSVYNVAPPGLVLLEEIPKLLDKKVIPISLFLSKVSLKVLSPALPKLPLYMLDYLSYSCMLDTVQIDKVLGPKFYKFSSEDALITLK